MVIVEHEGKRYTLVSRVPKVGELVLINNKHLDVRRVQETYACMILDEAGYKNFNRDCIVMEEIQENRKQWRRYRFCTYAVEDSRPLIFNPCYPWWCSGYGGEGNSSYATIVAYLPKDENLKTYWDDAFSITYTDEEEIVFTDRFPKPDYFQEML